MEIVSIEIYNSFFKAGIPLKVTLECWWTYRAYVAQWKYYAESYIDSTRISNYSIIIFPNWQGPRYLKNDHCTFLRTQTIIIKLVIFQYGS